MEVSDTLLESVFNLAKPSAALGQTARYIPELAKANPCDFGIALACADGKEYTAGLAGKRFSIQSISKAFSLLLVLETQGPDAVFSRVGKEPTGDPFNSIIRLETSSDKKPFNPFINAGAIVVAGMLPGNSAEARVNALRSFLETLLGLVPGSVLANNKVFSSERETGARNRAIAWFLREQRLVEDDVDAVLDTYFMQCSIMLSARELARVGLILALDGYDPIAKTRRFSEQSAHICKSLMVTCGMYDGSGEFAVETGIPAKSGVGGGILAAVRDRMGIGVYGPALDPRGNSCVGLEALSLLSRELDLRVL